MKSPFPAFILGVLAALMFAGMSALAAEPSSTKPKIPDVASLDGKARQEFEAMMDKLGLSDEQETQVRPVYEEALTRGKQIMQTALKELMGKKSSDEKTVALQRIKQELQSLRDDTDEKLSQILTPEQMKEMKRLTKQRQGELKKDYQQSPKK